MAERNEASAVMFLTPLGVLALVHLLGTRRSGLSQATSPARWSLGVASLLLALALAGVTMLPPWAGTARADTQEFGTPVSTREYDRSDDVGDPISAANGAYHFSKRLLSLGGPMDLGFELFYRSDYFRGDQSLPMAFWWRPLGTALVGSPYGGKEYATFYLPNGEQVVFQKSGSGEWVHSDPTVTFAGFTYEDNVPRNKYALRETTAFAYLMDPGAERVYVFQRYAVQSNGARNHRLARVLDRNDNQLVYTYPATDTRPTSIEDGLGRRLDLGYGAVGSVTYLQTVTQTATAQARRVSLNYEAGADNFGLTTLRSVTDPVSQTTTFRYSGAGPHVIAGEQLPRGNVPYTQTYLMRSLNGSTNPRVTQQTDAMGNATTLEYDQNANVITVRRPDGTVQRLEHSSFYGLPRRMTDTLGNAASYGKNAAEQITSVTDRTGSTTAISYHAESGKIASITNARGYSLTNTYTAQSQTFTNPISPTESVTFTFHALGRVDYPDGTDERFTYDARGNVLTRVDQAGQTWTNTYDARGQVLTAANPAGGIITYTYNVTDATLASRTDSDTGTTTFAYDAYKRLTRITRPDGSTVDIAYDLNDRVTSVTDERGNVTTFAYDANGNLTRVTNPAGNFITYTYDALDRPVQVTDRLGNTSNIAYDSLGRVQSLTDAMGVSAQWGYDPRDWVNQVTIGGRTWRSVYNAEGLVVETTTPLNSTVAYQHDALGFVSQVTNPLNQTTAFARDALSRVSSVTDPLGRARNFTYDQSGLLRSAGLPIAGSGVYTRTALGTLSQMADLGGRIWSFGYTPMGRLQSTTDPLGRTWQHAYDALGRHARTSFPDSAVLNRTYDAAGNLTRDLYSGATDIQYAYDSLNRLTSATGVQLTRDGEGKVVNTENPGVSFGATYDAAGRLKTVGYANSTFTVTYSYDAATGLLAGVTDNLSGAGAQVQLGYDAAFRLTNITRTNGVNTSLTWDGASRLTRIQDGSIVDLQYTLDAAGQVTQVTMTAPQDPAAALASDSQGLTFDAASQVSSAGYAYDQRGRMTASPGRTYTWDGASRLVGAGGASLGYNGLGDVITRTESGSTVRYYYSAAVGLRPIMAEKNEATDQFLRYYVWTPGGRLLYTIDAANGNRVYYYHFDRTGSTLALTDASGSVSDLYAYDPYGRLLARQGSNPQPFTFVGQWGVRQEGSSGALYQMRARYYDAATGRFLSRDPVWPQTADPLQINPYPYAANDPVGYMDPTGWAPIFSGRPDLGTSNLGPTGNWASGIQGNFNGRAWSPGWGASGFGQVVDPASGIQGDFNGRAWSPGWGASGFGQVVDPASGIQGDFNGRAWSPGWGASGFGSTDSWADFVGRSPTLTKLPRRARRPRRRSKLRATARAAESDDGFGSVRRRPMSTRGGALWQASWPDGVS
ncbi:MAG: hypothetical protein HY675_23490 [Chloroflexi bacterium]|nr:hypothetical protein [Chloroflexota bacterium]